MKKLVLSLVMVVLSANFMFGQMAGKIAGTVTDKITGEGLPFANVVLFQNGVQKGGAPTDFDGSFSISPLNPGTYDLKVQYQGYNPKEVRDFMVRAGATERINVALGEQVTEVIVVDVIIHEKKLINQDQTTSGTVLTAKDIAAMPTRDIATMANMGAGTYSADDGGEINIGGARGSSTVTYINGVKVVGNIGLPPSSIDQMQVMMRGIPAQFGDVTGGVINITTKGASSKFGGGFNAESSNLFDQWNQNVASLTITGPILSTVAFDEKGDTVKDGNGNAMKDTKLGYFAAVQYENQKDARPSAVPIYQVKDDIYQDILAEPLVRSGGGYSYKADQLLMDDLEEVKVRPNTGRQKLQFSGNLDFAPNDKTTITLGGSYNYSKINGYGSGFGGRSLSYVRLYSLLNSASKPTSLERNQCGFY